MLDKELARRKKIGLLKQKKKNKHAKVKSSHARADVVESLSDGKDDATPKLKKKRKKKLMESSSAVKVYESSVSSDDAVASKLKKKKRKVTGGKSSAGINDAEEILHENQIEETQSGKIASWVLKVFS